MQRNNDIFADTYHDFTSTNTVKMKIETGINPTMKSRFYRTPLNNHKVIEVDDMLDAGIISKRTYA